MSFLNDLGKKISGAAEVAADKAKDLANHQAQLRHLNNPEADR
jgi:hypothetical protein